MRIKKRSTITGAAALALALVASHQPSSANPHSGIDANLFKPSLDSTGVYTLEGGTVMEKGTITVLTSIGFGSSPLNAPVPGIGGTMDEEADSLLQFALGMHMGVGFALSDRFTIGLDVGLYRTDADEGYGIRGRYSDAGSTASTGIQSLRPLSNIDPAGSELTEGRGGPLDTRIGMKYRLSNGKKLRAAFIGILSVPFGDDEMFLGDSGLVFEPKLAVDYLLNKKGTSKFVFNIGARFRERTVLEAFVPTAGDESTAEVVLDVGSELVAGIGVNYELLDRFSVSAEGTFLVPLPPSTSFGDCVLNSGAACQTNNMTYFAGGDKGDPAGFALAGLNYRATPDTTIAVMAGVGLYGARKEAFRIMSGVVWTPTQAGSSVIGKGDSDGDGNPDTLDICPNEPEDKDGYKDEDGCPDLDNDGDGIIDAKDKCPDEPEDKDDYKDDDGCPEGDNDGDGVADVTDQCPNDPEDKDGFDDDDGCPDEDNDGDGFADKKDKCPNEAETVNGYRDNDGCPDVKPGGIRLAVDRIDLRGGVIKFTTKRGTTLTRTARTLLDQVARMINGQNRLKKKLNIRVEVHVSASYRGRIKWRKTRATRADKALSTKRGRVITNYLRRKRVPGARVRGSGVGSAAPIQTPAWRTINNRVDFIRITQ